MRLVGTETRTRFRIETEDLFGLQVTDGMFEFLVLLIDDMDFPLESRQRQLFQHGGIDRFIEHTGKTVWGY